METPDVRTNAEKLMDRAGQRFRETVNRSGSLSFAPREILERGGVFRPPLLHGPDRGRNLCRGYARFFELQISIDLLQNK
ncbi:hypothetical protein [Nitratireductor sp. L15S-10]|uniref:hypothetical protein n=1 Tax=Nitratireductor sp. L15S-10 TaxID=3034028 RepID=UPI0038574456